MSRFQNVLDQYELKWVLKTITSEKQCKKTDYYMANWSTMKRNILIGSPLSGLNFAIRTDDGPFTN